MLLLQSTNAGLSAENWIAISAITVTIIGSFIYLIYQSGKTMSTIEYLSNSVSKIDTDLQKIKGQTGKIGGIENSISLLWQHHFSIAKSPIQLNEKGISILESTDLKTVVENLFPKIAEKVKALNPTNSYEVQEYTKSVVEELLQSEPIKNQIENAAFSAGFHVSILHFIGAIFIRDKVIAELGFSSDDIDTHKPKD
jgi:uncharacterized protein YoxC